MIRIYQKRAKTVHHREKSTRKFLSYQANDSNPPSTIPLEAALQQQISQERLLSQVIAQIRQSLKLPVILETTVTEVRQFLQVDRLVIYQFVDTSFVAINPPKGRNNYGQITYESRLSDNIPTVLKLTTENDCFTDIPQYLEKYLDGQVIAVN